MCKGVQDFKDAKLFRRHLKNHENEKRKVICEFCQKGFYSDQLIEAMHSEADKIVTNSGYKVKDLDSDICGEKLENFIHNLNSYNLSG